MHHVRSNNINATACLAPFYPTPAVHHNAALHIHTLPCVSVGAVATKRIQQQANHQQRQQQQDRSVGKVTRCTLHDRQAIFATAAKTMLVVHNSMWIERAHVVRRSTYAFQACGDSVVVTNTPAGMQSSVMVWIKTCTQHIRLIHSFNTRTHPLPTECCGTQRPR